MSDANTASGDGNAAQIAYWNDKAAVTWTAFQERLDAVFAPLTTRAVNAAAPSAGERVIDIGCGCGATILDLARRVGPSGDVTGLDVSEPMSARARERIATEGLANAKVIVADASAYPFTGHDADLLFSRFGVMFFDEPVAAFANLRLAMRPGGRLLCAAWRELAQNSWFTLPLNAAGPLLPPAPPADPDAPGPFAFAEGERVRGILSRAGWTGIDLVRQDVSMRLAGPGELDAATEFATRIGPLARRLTEATSDERSRARQAVSDMLRTHDGPDGISLGGSIWLVSARA